MMMMFVLLFASVKSMSTYLNPLQFLVNIYRKRARRKQREWEKSYCNNNDEHAEHAGMAKKMEEI